MNDEEKDKKEDAGIINKVKDGYNNKKNNVSKFAMQLTKFASVITAVLTHLPLIIIVVIISVAIRSFSCNI